MAYVYPLFLVVVLESVRRGFIAVDETVVFNLSGRAYLWTAKEVRLYLYKYLGVGV
mgnify:CR=1 FL=1